MAAYCWVFGTLCSVFVYGLPLPFLVSTGLKLIQVNRQNIYNMERVFMNDMPSM